MTIDLRLGDCLELMREIPDASIDAVITDPPYGVDLEYGEYEDSFENWKALIDRFLPEAQRVSRDSVIVPTSKLEGEIYLYANHPPMWRVCWYKGASDTRCAIGWKDWETTFIYGKKKIARAHDHFYAGAGSVRNEVPEHPCPKPIEWALWFVERFTKEGMTVLDPFAGSGTTGVACVKLNRNFIGTEINPDYFAIAQRRIAEAQAQMTMALTT